MKRTILMAAASAMTLMITACGTNEEAAQNEAGNDTNAMVADAGNPFAQSEMQMNERMMAAVGTDVGDSWVHKMIEHHQGAIGMSQIVLPLNPSPDVAAMARMTIEKQGIEIQDLRKLVKQGSPNLQSGELYRPAMTQMHDAMMAAKGADVSETFLRKMLEHHKGGVTMSDVALQNGVSGVLRQQVQKTRDDQQKEAQMIEAMLRGETMQQAMQQSGAQSAQEAKAEPAPAAKAKTTAKVAPKSTPKAQPKPPPTAEPKPQPKPPAPTCAPEHRALGHC
ncbi:MAG: DUF305 domain-containing protein [Sphingomicrobium sp.]